MLRTGSLSLLLTESAKVPPLSFLQNSLSPVHLHTTLLLCELQPHSSSGFMGPSFLFSTLWDALCH